MTSIEDHGRFRADVRRRLASTEGEPDPAEIVEEIHAEIIDRGILPPRKEKDAERVIEILDQLERGSE
ncbi:hypothetical protein [Luteolibacter marinus]|uniref:hypothetical protein n=1 Tax=Luteolibacter marinus TaxID=2776705 RepID=UPI0018665271|nr:hypothetical protein [Luteolibacter marinus]